MTAPTRGRAIRRGGRAGLHAVRAAAVPRYQRGQRSRFKDQPRSHENPEPPPQGEHSGQPHAAGGSRAAATAAGTAYPVSSARSLQCASSTCRKGRTQPRQTHDREKPRDFDHRGLRPQKNAGSAAKTARTETQISTDSTDQFTRRGFHRGRFFNANYAASTHREIVLNPAIDRETAFKKSPPRNPRLRE